MTEDAEKPANQPLRLMRPGGRYFTVPPKMTMAELRDKELAEQHIRAEREAIRRKRARQLRSSASIAISRVAVPATTQLLRQADPVLEALQVATRSKPQQEVAVKPATRRQSYLKQHWRQMLIFFILAVVGYTTAVSVVVGEAVLAMFAVVAIVLRLESTFVFKLAFCSLLTTTIMVASGLNYDAASHFATYAFLLLVIGIILQTVEIVRAKNDRSSFRKV